MDASLLNQQPETETPNTGSSDATRDLPITNRTETPHPQPGIQTTRTPSIIPRDVVGAGVGLGYGIKVISALFSPDRRRRLQEVDETFTAICQNL